MTFQDDGGNDIAGVPVQNVGADGSIDLTPLNLASVPQLENGGQTPTNALFIPKRDVTLQTAFDSYDGGIYYREPIRKTFVTSASYAHDHGLTPLARFVAFATVAMQHPDLAVKQLEDGIKKLGLRGMSVGGSVEGRQQTRAPLLRPQVCAVTVHR